MKTLREYEVRYRGDLWVGIALALSLTLYHFFSLAGYSFPSTSTVFADWGRNFLFFWMLILLWLGYRRWRSATQQELDLRRILSSISTELVMVVNRQRRIEICNEAVVNIFGYEPAEVIGATTDKLYGDRRKNANIPEVKLAIDRLGFHVGKAVGIRKNGETFNLELVTAQMKGRPGAVILARDVSQRVRYEEAILQAKESAELAHAEKTRLLVRLEENYGKLRQLEKLRDDLTHMVVHDMRTPLQVILLAVETLKVMDSEWYAREEASLDEVLGQTRRLMTMVNTLLDVSRLENGKFPIRKSTLNLHNTVRDAVASIGSLADGLDLTTGAANGPLLAEYDGEIVQRVIVNLLVNAVKFTPPAGRIHVEATGWNGSAEVSVTDTGPGIPPEHHERIFQKFGQAGQPRKVNFVSTGLGLAFCRLAVEAHGGKIGFSSEPGKGCRFWFRLPTHAPTAIPANADPQAAQEAVMRQSVSG